MSLDGIGHRLAGASAALPMTARGVVTTAAMLSALLGAAPVAAEQREPKGAEQRYEVTIAPPRRPGSPVAQPADADDAATGAAADQNADSAPAANTAESGPPASEAGEPSPAGQADGSTAAATATAPTKTEGPRLTLQVGAYRQRRSAEQLRDKLAATFRDVAIVDATSGGEPLYRVRVGRLPKGPALEDIKRRLLAAGYPAFEVAAAGDAQQP